MIRRTYLCPNCSARLAYDHHPSIEADPCPTECPKCHYDSQQAMPQALSMPHIATGTAKNVDGYYKATEEGADHRATMAQEMFGLDKAEANVMRITDMKDGMREGDTADVPVQNAVTQTMQQVNQIQPGMMGHTPQGLNWSANTSQGPAPNAGLRAMRDVKNAHRKFTQSAGHAGTTTSDLPALETQMPGYQRRL